MCLDITTGMRRPSLQLSTVQPLSCLFDAAPIHVPVNPLRIPRTKEEEEEAIKVIFSVFIEEIPGSQANMIKMVTETDDILRRLHIAVLDPRNISGSGKSTLVSSFLWKKIFERMAEIESIDKLRRGVIDEAIDNSRKYFENPNKFQTVVVIDSYHPGL